MNRKDEIIAFANANNIPEEHIPFFEKWVIEYDKGNEPDKFTTNEKLNELNLSVGLDVMRRYMDGWSKKHSSLWTKTYAESIEDEEVAEREAYEAVRKFFNCGRETDDSNLLYKEAYESCLAEGKSENYAAAFAFDVVNDVESIDQVRLFASAVDRQMPKKSKIFAYAYASHITGDGGEDNSLYYADYYEQATKAEKGERYAYYFADSLIEELANAINLNYGEQPRFDHLNLFAVWKFKADAREYGIENRFTDLQRFIDRYSQECMNEIFPKDDDDDFEFNDSPDEEYLMSFLIEANVRLTDTLNLEIITKIGGRYK